MIEKGATMSFKKPPEKEQGQKDNDARLLYNNQKKVSDNPDIIQRSIQQDADLRFCIPILISTALRVPSAMLCPLGDTQLDIHCSNFSKSVKNLTDTSDFLELIFFFILSVGIHHILSLWWHNPTTSILLYEFDFSKAYSQVHYDPDAAAN
jgi:hypothetical protein